MYLIDTNVVSESRKTSKANPGVIEFFRQVAVNLTPVYLSTVTVGELRRGIELIRHRGEASQAGLLEAWLTKILADYRQHILGFDAEAAQVWGKLRVPDPAQAIDKQIAATALVHDLTVVSRNATDFAGCGVKLLNPFR